MSEWNPLDTAPKFERVLVKLSTGREVVAEYCGPGTGWYMECLDSIIEGTHEADFDAEYIGWKPLPDGETAETGA